MYSRRMHIHVGQLLRQTCWGTVYGSHQIKLAPSSLAGWQLFGNSDLEQCPRSCCFRGGGHAAMCRARVTANGGRCGGGESQEHGLRPCLQRLLQGMWQMDGQLPKKHALDTPAWASESIS